MDSLVSVIIPTYNRLELLKRAIESVKNQSYSNIEIIIIDGSTNNETQLFLEHNNQLTYIKNKSNHSNVLRNIGINTSNGELLAFLDDDDTWECTKIEKQVKIF